MTTGEDKAAALDAPAIARAIREADGSTSRAASALGVPVAPFRARYRALRTQVDAILDGYGKVLAWYREMGDHGLPASERAASFRVSGFGNFDTETIDAARQQFWREQDHHTNEQQPITVMTVENDADLASHVTAAKSERPPAGSITALSTWLDDALEPVHAAWRNHAITAAAYSRAVDALDKLNT